MRRYPIWVSRTSALFSKQYLDTWNGLDTITTELKHVVTAPFVGKQIGLSTYEVKSRPLAIKMLLAGRMRYYLDDQAILQSLTEGRADSLAFEEGITLTELTQMDWTQYTIREVTTQSWHMIFPPTERGKKIRNIFDTGFRRLHQSGELRALYEKWNLESCMIKELPETDTK